MNKARTKAYEFLSQHTLAVLSTNDSKQHPWGTAIYYAVNESLDFYFLTHTDTEKYHNLERDKHVALTITHNEQQITVQASGLAELVPDASEESSEAFRMLANVHPPGELRWTPPVSKIHDGKTVVFKVTPTFLRYSDFKAHTATHQANITDVIS